MKTLRTHKICALLATISISLTAQNRLDNYLSGGVTFVTVAGVSDGISQPRDLDFKPYSDELWVALRGGNAGGGNLIIYDAGKPQQTSEYRKDTHSDHFNRFTSALAFSDIGEYATVGEYKPSNSTFMGPSLWSADTAIFARVFQNNWFTDYPLGSHLDMLHQSPYAMGIAHDSAKIYWVFDGYNGNICKYNYVADHGPGYDTHSAGKIWRYTGVSVGRVPNIPSHLVVDRVNKWLYFIDGASKSLKRLKTSSGTVVGNLTATNEYLSGYYNMGNTALVETIETFTDQPCGIDYFNDRLVVSDYNTGLLTLYSTATGSVVKLGTLATNQAGIMGIKIGPDGNIWFVNNTLNTVIRADAAPAPNDAAIQGINNPSVAPFRANYYSPLFNWCGDEVNPVVTLANTGANSLTSVELRSRIDDGPLSVFNWTGSLAPGATTTVSLDAITVPTGRHLLQVFTSAPNGTVDSNPANDRREGAFRTISTVELPYTENFSLNTFPPTGWDIIGFNKYSYLKRDPSVSSYSLGTGSLKMANFTYESEINIGQTDYAVLPQINLTNAVSQTSLEFVVAYARLNGSTNDRLKLQASDDCGKTWSTLYDMAGATLTTAAETGSPFVPKPWEWRIETVGLDQYAGKKLLLMFTFVSASGNDVYIDDIKVSSMNLVGLDASSEHLAPMITPNPAQHQFSVSLPVSGSESSSLRILDISGRLICRFETSQPVIHIETASWPRGLYFVQVSHGGQTVVRKIVLD